MRRFYKMVTILFALSLALAGCAKTADSPESAAQIPSTAAPVATGRYVETEITPPGLSGGEGSLLAAIPHGDGSVDCFLCVRLAAGPEKEGWLDELRHYRSPDGGVTWEQKDTSWTRQAAAFLGKEDLMDQEPKSGEVVDRLLVRSIDMDDSGTIYCTTYGDMRESRLIKVTPDGVSEIPVPGWRLENLVPRSLAATAEGRIGVVFEDGYAALYNGETGALLAEAREDYGLRFAWNHQPGAFFHKQIAMLDEGGQLILYGNGVPKAFDLPQTGDAVAAGVNGGLYIASRKGVICLGKNMSVFETVMDGSLYQYSDPTRDILALRYQPETDTFFMLLGSNQPDGKVQLYRYAYDPDMPRKPDKQLNVISLGENGTMRKAILQFQTRHPDVAVNYTAYYAGDSSLSDAETEAAKMKAVRGLEQKLQEGDFDVAVLDGMDIQTYIDGGKLADLGVTPELAGCFPITSAWKQGDALWAIPARFAVSMDAMEDDLDLESAGILQMQSLRRSLRNGSFQFAENPFNARIVTGIGARGQKDLAKELIACMLSDDVQSADLEDGLPVSMEAFDRQAAWESTFGEETFTEICAEIKNKMNVRSGEK